ncbi:restriction endonuclease subunit S [Pasteurella sp. PK-2025]|uniref:restriction endonuclease subunit S n=1 Tax=unclassified Pasteurella TaxID=2621516 RepID=UPI003C7501F3
MKQNNMIQMIEQSQVEWKNLWEVTIWDKNFNAVEREKQEKIIKYHYFLASELKSLSVKSGNVKLLTTNFSDLWTTEELVGDKISDGEIVAIPWGGNPIVQYFKGKFVTADNRIATSKDTTVLDNKFLYYFLLSKLDLISSFYRGSGIKHPSMLDVLNLQIPIPPLETQKEIVRILDALTAVTSELKLRQKQYQYYRDHLLSFGDEVEWKTLDKIAKNFDSMRKPIKSGLREKGKIPYYGASGIVDYVQDYIFDGDFLLISEDGANLLARNTPIAFSVSGKSWVNNHAHVLQFSTYAERKFVEHYLNNIDLSPYISGAAQPKLNKQNLNNIKIPSPPLTTQQKIVEILDKFDRLTNSISEGLPKEIELRRKQYEYYRDTLLNFPK